MTKNNLESLNPAALKIIKEIGVLAQELGVSIYIVGGVVRDILLGKRNLDLDLVVVGDAIHFAKKFAHQKKMRVVTHPQFGTATLVYDHQFRVDFSSARKERYAHSGALPEVTSGELREDLFRRDFTVNAMAINIVHDHFGEVIDPYGGQDDLKAGVIRILHDESFIDDPTRILRAVRFEQRLGFTIEPRTLQFLKAAIEKKAVSNVKPNRYFVEFKKILSESFPVKYLKRLEEFSGFDFIHRDLEMNYPVLQRLERRLPGVQDKLKKTIVLEGWLIYFLGIVAKSNPSVTSRLGERLHLKREEREALSEIKYSADIAKNLSKTKLSPSRARRFMEQYSVPTVVFAALSASQNNLSPRVLRYLIQDKDVKLHINGHDIQALGIQSGKKIKKILDRLLDMKIDGKCRSREDELRAARMIIEEA